MHYSHQTCLTAFGIASLNSLHLQRLISMKRSSGKTRPSCPQEHLRQHIEKSIVHGTFQPGDRLPGEEKLCLEFGLSRPAVREALQGLKTKGLIVSRNGSGTYVAKDSGARPLRDSIGLYSALRRDGSSFLELLDLRLMIECFCVQRLTGPETIPAREKLLSKLRQMEISAGDSEAFGLADIAFHLAIIEGARHDLFSNIMQGLLPKLGVRFMRETYIEEGLEEKILDEHRSICRALERGEGTLAAKLLKLHLTASRRHLEKLLTRPI